MDSAIDVADVEMSDEDVLWGQASGNETRQVTRKLMKTKTRRDESNKSGLASGELLRTRNKETTEAGPSSGQTRIANCGRGEHNLVGG